MVNEIENELGPVRDAARLKVRDVLWNGDKQEKLINLYQRMYEFTLPQCKKCSQGAGSCCNIAACETAEKYALNEYGVKLLHTGHSKLKYMSAKGCTVAPHLRPFCTVHTCKMVVYGCDFQSKQWTSDYFDLRREIALLECDRIEWRRRGNSPL